MNEINDIKNYKNVLLFEDEMSLQATINNILRRIQNNPVIYIALIKPYNSILANLNKNKVKTDKIFFIDGVTKLTKENVIEQENILFGKSTDLTGLGITIIEFMKAIRGEKWVILDALRILTIYNKQNAVLRFIQFLLEMAPRYNARIITLTTKKEDASFIENISQYFEKVIELNK